MPKKTPVTIADIQARIAQLTTRLVESPMPLQWPTMEPPKAGRLSARPLARYQQELEAERYAPGLKKAVIELYGGQCVGDCGTNDPDALFVKHTNELLAPEADCLHPGPRHVLSAHRQKPLLDFLFAQTAETGVPPAGYAVFCWKCFIRLGRKRRRSEGIRSVQHPRSRQFQAWEEEALARAARKAASLDCNDTENPEA